MQVLFDNYEKYTYDDNYIIPISNSFIDKYKIMPYSKDEEAVIFIHTKDFNLFAINKLSYFTNDNIILCEVSSDVWNMYYELNKSLKGQQEAVSTYLSSIPKVESRLEEGNSFFYNVDINNSPIVKLVESIIKEAIMLKASDIHLEPFDNEILVRFRIDGVLLNKNSIEINLLQEFISRIKVLASLDITKKLVPQDGKIPFILNGKEYDIRVSILPTIYGERVVLRILDNDISLTTLSELGFTEAQNEEVSKLINTTSGIILLVGPTGSGKSTTLKSFIMENVKKKVNIITVEDPVEYKIPGVSQVQINEEASLDFSTCLRSILRQDPNIIMIGEIRDSLTAKIACRASITGHLVFSTLHTNTSIGVINRLLDMGVENYLLEDALKGIISQRLVRKLCPKCKELSAIQSYEQKYLKNYDITSIYHPVGCSYCNMTGYKGRIGVYEIITIDDEIRELISNSSSSTKINKLIEKKKIKTLKDNGCSLVISGVTTVDELMSSL